MANRSTPAQFTYAQVERALAAMFEIRKADFGAFKARIRHLRKLGIPDLPATGSGVKIKYTWQDAVDLVVALRFQDMGAPPKTAMLAVQFVRVHIKDLTMPGWMHRRDRMYYVAVLGASRWEDLIVAGCVGEEEAVSAIDIRHGAAVINLTLALQDLEARLGD